MWLDILKKLALKLLAAILTEKFIKKLVVFLLKKLAERSDNKIDDEVVKMIEEALEEKPKK